MRREIYEGSKAHYLPLLTCLNYLLSRTEHGKGPGLSAVQRRQVALAMRFSQLRDLSAELAQLGQRAREQRGRRLEHVAAAVPLHHLLHLQLAPQRRRQRLVRVRVRVRLP